MLQRIDLIGNLVADAEIKTGKDGKDFISFRLAVSENFGEEKRTTFFNVTCAKSGVIEYLKEGIQVFVTGRFGVSNREKDGKMYTNLNVTASQVCLCSTPRN